MLRIMGKNFNARTLIPVLLAAGAAVALWYFWKTADQPAPVTVTTDPVPAETLPELPRYPRPPRTEAQYKTRQLTPLPSLDDGDAYFKLALVQVFGEGVDELLVRFEDGGDEFAHDSSPALRASGSSRFFRALRARYRRPSTARSESPCAVAISRTERPSR